MLAITFFNVGPKYFNIEQRFLQKLLYFNISSYIKELMFLGFEYSFYSPLILTLESTKGYFFTSPLLRFNELLKLNFNIKEFNVLSYTQKHTNSYLHFLNLIRSFNNINAFSSSLHIMANTGAKANWNQICQLIGVRGYLSNATGEFFKIPVLSSFNKGLNLFEYFISCYGARKGILDTALKTADAGYLTRRLVESTQELVIKEYNCGSTNSYEYISQINTKGNIILPFFLLISGKVLQKNLVESSTKKIIEFKYNHISEKLINSIYYSSTLYNFLIKINTFSIKTCITGRTICSTCFGYTTFKTNNLGKSVGILSGQVIGEPGTQLTLRTFHTGGVSALNNMSLNKKNNLALKFKYLYFFKSNKYKLCATYRKVLKRRNNTKLYSFIYLKQHYFTLNPYYLLFVIKKYKLNQIISINNRLIYSKNNIYLSNLLLTYLSINNISQRNYLINNNYEHNYTGEFLYKNVLQLIVKNKYNKFVVLNLNKSILYNKYYSTHYTITNEKIIFIRAKNQRFSKVLLSKHKSFLYSYKELKNELSNIQRIFLLSIIFSKNSYSYNKLYVDFNTLHIYINICQAFKTTTTLIK